MKFMPLDSRDARSAAFQSPYQLGKRQFLRLFDEQMHMVGFAVHFLQSGIGFSASAGEEVAETTNRARVKKPAEALGDEDEVGVGFESSAP